MCALRCSVAGRSGRRTVSMCGFRASGLGGCLLLTASISIVWCERQYCGRSRPLRFLRSGKFVVMPLPLLAPSSGVGVEGRDLWDVHLSL